MKGHVKNKLQLWQLASVDFFTVPTIWFEVLFVFVVLAHDRQRVLHFNVTAHPTAVWTAQQKCFHARHLAVPQLSARRLDAASLGSDKGGTCYRARNPPSIGKTCPVIKEAASEHSHTTAPATSSGVPNRPIGCSAINCGSSSGVWKPPRSVIAV